MSRRTISLVSMPWHLLGSPSIQLGTIQALAERSGIPCRSHSLHLQFAADLFEQQAKARLRFSPEDYAAISDLWSNVGAGEWAFAVEPLRKQSRSAEEEYAEILRRNKMPKELRRKLTHLREFVPGFLDRCADEILAENPAAVGFTVTYGQRTPSLALACLIKERSPETRIVLGGAGCEAGMGPALLRAFDFVDLVVRGKVEGIAEELLAALSEACPLPRLAGLCWRDGEELVEIPEGPDNVPMDEIPVPAFDEYFRRLERLAIAGAIMPELPIESSRGCWWGAKQHCTFCGLNGNSMAYRSKSPERVAEEFQTQSSRFGVLEFTAVDNILDMGYLSTLMPVLAERQIDLNIFYESKSNLTFDQVRAMRLAGVRRLQPGLESLSSGILKLMKKGTTGLQNIRLLKWCKQLGIHLDWNLLYGFPGEDPAEYRRMAEIAPSLFHLVAPRLIRIMIDRFSPYFTDPAGHGLELHGPLPYMSCLFDVEPDVLEDMSSSFLYTYLDGRDPEGYVTELRQATEAWQQAESTGTSSLTFRRGPNFITITDQRFGQAPARYVLESLHSAVYQACDSGMNVAKLTRMTGATMGEDVSEDTVRGVLKELSDARLVYEEKDRYLSLAIPADNQIRPA